MYPLACLPGLAGPAGPDLGSVPVDLIQSMHLRRAVVREPSSATLRSRDTEASTLRLKARPRNGVPDNQVREIRRSGSKEGAKNGPSEGSGAASSLSHAAAGALPAAMARLSGARGDLALLPFLSGARGGVRPSGSWPSRPGRFVSRPLPQGGLGPASSQTRRRRPVSRSSPAFFL